MPSANDENEAANVAKAYQDLIKGERTASELESRLDTLDARLDDLLKLIPPELMEQDNGMFKQNAEKLFGNSNGEEKSSGKQVEAKKE